MNQPQHIIEHVIDPKKLLLIWRSQGDGQTHMRRAVAEITLEHNGAILRYLMGSPDFEAAVSEGFKEYPAFRRPPPEHRQGVLDTFLRRLPPRNREDFGEYLTSHRLPNDLNISEMALLAYTGAKLPGDGFEICADFESAHPPFEIVLEVAGFRHQSNIPAENIIIGSTVKLLADPENQSDGNAVAVFYANNKIGYLPRTFNGAFSAWVKMGFKVKAAVERINGTPERPLVYLYVTVR